MAPHLSILVLNNGTYGTIRMHQEREYPGRVSGADIINPDFAVFAQAYGMHGETVRQTDEFEAAFERACASKTGGLIELMIDSEGISPKPPYPSCERTIPDLDP